MIISKINEYFKELQKSDSSAYNKRIASFEKIIDAMLFIIKGKVWLK